MTHPIVKNANKESTKFTGLTSTVTRSLNLSLVAIVWLFGSAGSGQPTTVLSRISSIANLRYCLSFASAALAADFLQYVWGAVSWRSYRWIVSEIFDNDRYPMDAPGLHLRLAWCLARVLGMTDYFRESCSLESELVKQYDSGAALPRSSNWKERRRVLRLIVDDDSILFLEAKASPPLLNLGVSTFFWLKIVLLSISFVYFGLYLGPHWFSS